MVPGNDAMSALMDPKLAKLKRCQKFGGPAQTCAKLKSNFGVVFVLVGPWVEQKHMRFHPTLFGTGFPVSYGRKMRGKMEEGKGQGPKDGTS